MEHFHPRQVRLLVKELNFLPLDRSYIGKIQEVHESGWRALWH